MEIKVFSDFVLMFGYFFLLALNKLSIKNYNNLRSTIWNKLINEQDMSQSQFLAIFRENMFFFNEYSLDHGFFSECSFFSYIVSCTYW
jgi:hypothetical protein